jgi:FkbM family methyltransferase
MKQLGSLLPLTLLRIFGAKILFFFVRLFIRKNKVIAHRNKLNFELDLGEGIDLSIYLFGNFQGHVFKNKFIRINPASDPVIIDVGANIGAMSLRFAEQYKATVYGFEPTDYAFGKLKRNLELNPDLSKRIFITQCFLSDKNEDSPNLIAYSSWRVDGKSFSETHPLHGGSAMAAENIPSFRLDTWIEKNALTKVDLLKIDTDGHEYEVLAGAANTLARFKPVVIFEASVYQMKENGVQFSDFEKIFRSLGYKIYNARNNKEITPENAARMVPEKTGIDLIAVPGN